MKVLKNARIVSISLVPGEPDPSKGTYPILSVKDVEEVEDGGRASAGTTEGTGGTV